MDTGILRLEVSNFLRRGFFFREVWESSPTSESFKKMPKGSLNFQKYSAYEKLENELRRLFEHHSMNTVKVTCSERLSSQISDFIKITKVECNHDFGPGDFSIICRTCSKDTLFTSCCSCFSSTNHKDHDLMFRIYLSQDFDSCENRTISLPCVDPILQDHSKRVSGSYNEGFTWSSDFNDDMCSIIGSVLNFITMVFMRLEYEEYSLTTNVGDIIWNKGYMECRKFSLEYQRGNHDIQIIPNSKTNIYDCIIIDRRYLDEHPVIESTSIEAIIAEKTGWSSQYVKKLTNIIENNGRAVLVYNTDFGSLRKLLDETCIGKKNIGIMSSTSDVYDEYLAINLLLWLNILPYSIRGLSNDTVGKDPLEHQIRDLILNVLFAPNTHLNLKILANKKNKDYSFKFFPGVILSESNVFLRTEVHSMFKKFIGKFYSKLKIYESSDDIWYTSYTDGDEENYFYYECREEHLTLFEMLLDSCCKAWDFGKKVITNFLLELIIQCNSEYKNKFIITCIKNYISMVWCQLTNGNTLAAHRTFFLLIREIYANGDMGFVADKYPVLTLLLMMAKRCIIHGTGTRASGQDTRVLGRSIWESCTNVDNIYPKAAKDLSEEIWVDFCTIITHASNFLIPESSRQVYFKQHNFYELEMLIDLFTLLQSACPFERGKEYVTRPPVQPLTIVMTILDFVNLVGRCFRAGDPKFNGVIIARALRLCVRSLILWSREEIIFSRYRSVRTENRQTSMFAYITSFAKSTREFLRKDSSYTGHIVSNDKTSVIYPLHWLMSEMILCGFKTKLQFLAPTEGRVGKSNTNSGESISWNNTTWKYLFYFDDLSDYNNVESTVLLTLDYALRAFVFEAQVEIGSWMRCGDLITSQSNLMRKTNCCPKIYNLLLIQIASVIVNPNDFVLWIISKFEIAMNSSQNIPSAPTLSRNESLNPQIFCWFFKLLITTIVERLHLSNISCEEEIKYYILHHMASASENRSLTYTRILESVPRRIYERCVKIRIQDYDYKSDFIRIFDTCLSEIAVLQNSHKVDQNSTYSIREDKYQDINIWFSHYTCKESRRAEYAKLSKLFPSIYLQNTYKHQSGVNKNRVLSTKDINELMDKAEEYRNSSNKIVWMNQNLSTLFIPKIKIPDKYTGLEHLGSFTRSSTIVKFIGSLFAELYAKTMRNSNRDQVNSSYRYPEYYRETIQFLIASVRISSMLNQSSDISSKKMDFFELMGNLNVFDTFEMPHSNSVSQYFLLLKNKKTTLISLICMWLSHVNSNCSQLKPEDLYLKCLIEDLVILSPHGSPVKNELLATLNSFKSSIQENVQENQKKNKFNASHAKMALMDKIAHDQDKFMNKFGFDMEINNKDLTVDCPDIPSTCASDLNSKTIEEYEENIEPVNKIDEKKIPRNYINAEIEKTESNFPEMKCIVCRATNAAHKNRGGIICYASRRNVVKSVKLSKSTFEYLFKCEKTSDEYSDQSPYYFQKGNENFKEHANDDFSYHLPNLSIQSCGHLIHYSCFANSIGLGQEVLDSCPHVFNTWGKRENFRCPLCLCVSNCVMPLMWDKNIVSVVSPSHIPEEHLSNFQMDLWWSCGIGKYVYNAVINHKYEIQKQERLCKHEIPCDLETNEENFRCLMDNDSYQIVNPDNHFYGTIYKAQAYSYGEDELKLWVWNDYYINPHSHELNKKCSRDFFKINLHRATPLDKDDNVNWIERVMEENFVHLIDSLDPSGFIIPDSDNYNYDFSINSKRMSSNHAEGSLEYVFILRRLLRCFGNSIENYEINSRDLETYPAGSSENGPDNSTLVLRLISELIQTYIDIMCRNRENCDNLAEMERQLLSIIFGGLLPRSDCEDNYVPNLCRNTWYSLVQVAFLCFHPTRLSTLSHLYSFIQVFYRIEVMKCIYSIISSNFSADINEGSGCSMRYSSIKNKKTTSKTDFLDELQNFLDEASLLFGFQKLDWYPYLILVEPLCEIMLLPLLRKMAILLSVKFNLVPEMNIGEMNFGDLRKYLYLPKLEKCFTRKSLFGTGKMSKITRKWCESLRNYSEPCPLEFEKIYAANIIGKNESLNLSLVDFNFPSGRNFSINCSTDYPWQARVNIHGRSVFVIPEFDYDRFEGNSYIYLRDPLPIKLINLPRKLNDFIGIYAKLEKTCCVCGKRADTVAICMVCGDSICINPENKDTANNCVPPEFLKHSSTCSGDTCIFICLGYTFTLLTYIDKSHKMNFPYHNHGEFCKILDGKIGPGILEERLYNYLKKLWIENKVQDIVLSACGSDLLDNAEGIEDI